MPSTDLVLRSQSDVPESFNEQMRMAQAVAASGLLPAHLREKPANVLVILAGARALGISWFWACQSLYVVEGKLSYSAELMRALVIRAGHKFRILEHSNQKAEVEIVRSDDPEKSFTVEFTMADAKTAELTGKGTWKKYGKSMLLARATSMAVRAYCPDVLFGVVYTPEELGARVDESGEPVVNDNGNIVLDTAEVVGEVEVPQSVVDQAGEDIWANTDLKASAASYVMLAKQQYLDMVPNLQFIEGNPSSLKQLWIERLFLLLKEADKERCTLVWQVASGTDVLGEKLREDGPDLRAAIQDRVAEVKKQQEAALAKMQAKNEAFLDKVTAAEEPEAALPVIEDAEVIADITTT